jgi:hypothetical protein
MLNKKNMEYKFLDDNNNNGDILANKKPENFEFYVGIKDTIFALTINNSRYKENINTIITKMVTLKEERFINLDNLSVVLNTMKIENLNIFIIDKDSKDNINIINTNKGCNIIYVEMNDSQFVNFINTRSEFLDYNKNSLYILKNGTFLILKNIFANVSINGYQVNLGRWRGSKSTCT